MVGKVIRDYMEAGAKKLTVPGFGTFMRRESGEVVFVDLLRGDDKTLGELVEDRGGYSELEAMALVDRFIFETKHAIERNGSADIDGFGNLTLDHKGVYQFHYSPKPRLVPETAVQERLFEVGPKAGVARSHPSVKTGGNIDTEFSSHRGLKPSGVQSRTSSGSSGGVKKTLPSVKSDRPRGRSTSKDFSTASNGKTDRILIIAIVAAAIALIAMLFGLTSGGHMPFLQK